MSIINPNYIWISSEGATGLSKKKCEFIKDYQVVLFPDAGWYNDNPNKNTKGWLSVADDYDFEISRECENWRDRGLIEQGDDIVDYYIKTFPNDLKTTLQKPDKYDKEWNQDEYDIIFKSSQFKSL